MSTQAIPVTGSFTTGVRPRYDDREKAPVWMRITGAILFLGGLGLVAAVLGWPGEGPEIALLVPGLVAVVIGFLLMTAQSGVTIDGEAVTLHFRPLPRRQIRRDQIADVRLVEADGSTYGGLGLRLARRRRALLMTPGLGIEFTDDRGRVTFVRTHGPEDAFRALAEQPHSAGTGRREALD